MRIHNQPVLIAETRKPDSLREWIDHPESLTDKLQEAIGSFDLELLFQNWVKPNWWDKFLLQAEDDRVFMREIIMKDKGVVYWYARSLIPQKCYNRDPLFFKRLEHESIRNLIFGESRVERLNMISYPVNQQNIEFYWVKKYLSLMKETLWVRFAEYLFEGVEPFYLIEILLPELESVS